MEVGKSIIIGILTSVLIACDSGGDSNTDDSIGTNSTAGSDGTLSEDGSNSNRTDIVSSDVVSDTGLSDDFDINLDGLEIVSHGNLGSEDIGAYYEINRSDGAVYKYYLDIDNNLSVDIDYPIDPDFSIRFNENNLTKELWFGENKYLFEWEGRQPGKITLIDRAGNIITGGDSAKRREVKQPKFKPPYEYCEADKRLYEKAKQACDIEDGANFYELPSAYCNSFRGAEKARCYAVTKSIEAACNGINKNNLGESIPGATTVIEPFIDIPDIPIRNSRCLADDDGDGASNEDDICPLDKFNRCEQTPEPEPIADKDRDTIPDDIDNCPDHPNLYQHDRDFDDIGNACDRCNNNQPAIQIRLIWGVGNGERKEFSGSYKDEYSYSGDRGESYFSSIKANASVNNNSANANVNLNTSIGGNIISWSGLGYRTQVWVREDHNFNLSWKQDISLRATDAGGGRTGVHTSTATTTTKNKSEVSSSSDSVHAPLNSGKVAAFGTSYVGTHSGSAKENPLGYCPHKLVFEISEKHSHYSQQLGDTSNISNFTVAVTASE